MTNTSTTNTKLRRAGLGAMALTVSFGMAACGTTDEPASSAPPASSSSSPTTSPSEPTQAVSGEFGDSCSAVPATGAGSFAGMSEAPVASAASANPVLETLVTAVSEAGLVDALNSAEDITVFAPANDAFAGIAPEDLNALLADKAALTKVLQYHVVPGKLSPEDLAGTHTTLEGSDVTVEGSGEQFTVGDADANVICGNVQTANATVYIIDDVLMPAA